jgi:Tannase and feruloyl esterase
MTPELSPRFTARARVAALFSLAAASALVTACGGGGGDNPAPAAAPTPAPAPVALTCDDTMKTAFQPDANTTVLLVKAFKKGDALTLGTATTPVATNDVCLVKLNVGPGNPGPASAPSTSPGIGIEIWLPSAPNWNQKIHNMGGGGWAGGNQGSLTALGSSGNGVLAGTEGSVVASTDTGHTIGNGSFAMNPDGTINSTLWQDFAERSLHELALKTKALTAAYYLQAQKFAYWDGCSTGGRQGYKIIQNHADDYNGYLVGAPAFNWTKFITAELYPQIVYQRDLGGVALTTAQQQQVSAKAVSACDVVGGQHLGFILNPDQCTYDPARDATALCTGTVGTGGVVGTNATAACVTPLQAQAQNKIWFGQTPDGSVPDPLADNGYNANLTSNQLWYGLTRGASSGLAGASPFTISSDMTALELQDPTIATPAFTNAVSNGLNRWQNLTYGQLANAFAEGIALQPFFGNINTDSADLSAAQKAGVKILQYHGSADVLIPTPNSVNYYTRVANLDGGFAKTQAYDRLFLIAGMGHCSGVGTQQGTAGVSPPATTNSVPLPATGQLFTAMTSWVESGTAPATITLQSADASASQLLCPYPQRPTYSGAGAINAAGSYTCK